MRYRLHATPDNRSRKRATCTSVICCWRRHTKPCARHRRGARRSERRRGNNSAQTTRPWSLHQHHAADRRATTATDPFRASNTSTSIAKIYRRGHRMRKWCAATEIERDLRRLMRHTTRHVTQRTLYQRDLLVNAWKKAEDICLAEIPNVYGFVHIRSLASAS